MDAMVKSTSIEEIADHISMTAAAPWTDYVRLSDGVLRAIATGCFLNELAAMISVMSSE